MAGQGRQEDCPFPAPCERPRVALAGRVPAWRHADFDTDGMADDWELLFGVDIPTNDEDKDGYSNLQEFENGSDPTLFDGLPGDINNDGLINIADLLKLQRYLIQGISLTDVERAHADVYPSGNPDGLITLSDSLILGIMLIEP